MEENIKLYMQYRKNYYERMRLIKQRVEEGKKIRVGFFVQSLSSFSALPLYETMRKDELFDAKIVMYPSVYNMNNASHLYEEAEKVFGKEQVINIYIYIIRKMYIEVLINFLI